MSFRRVGSLDRLTSEDAGRRREGVLVIPVGATEQHGPHLPLGTDTSIAVAITDRLAAARPADVVVAPAVAFGSSGEHQAFAGTLSVGQDALEQYLVELGRSASCAWDRILIASTHGGNRSVARRATAALRREGRDVRVWTADWPGDAHAGRTETSLMLAIAPDDVALELAAGGASEPIADLMPRLVRKGVAAVSPNGVLGDPAGASAQEGERLLEVAVDSLCALVDGWPAGQPSKDEVR